MHTKFRRHHLNRLIKLRDVMKSAKRTKNGSIFELGKNRVLFEIDIVAADQNSVDVDEDYINAMKAANCGTAACVIGTAGLIPEFRKSGLRTHERINDVTIKYRDGSEFVGDYDEIFSEFFGCSKREAEDICSPYEYDVTNVQPKHVVTKLDLLIKKAKSEIETKGE